jgi:hypothetical protein
LIAVLGVLVMEMELFSEWVSCPEKTQTTIVDSSLGVLAYDVNAEFFGWEVSEGLKK